VGDNTAISKQMDISPLSAASCQAMMMMIVTSEFHSLRNSSQLYHHNIPRVI